MTLIDELRKCMDWAESQGLDLAADELLAHIIGLEEALALQHERAR